MSALLKEKLKGVECPPMDADIVGCNEGNLATLDDFKSCKTETDIEALTLKCSDIAGEIKSFGDMLKNAHTELEKQNREDRKKRRKRRNIHVTNSKKRSYSFENNKKKP